MEEEKLKQEYQEWINAVRLAHLKRLSLNEETLDNNELTILKQFRSALLNDGVSEEFIKDEVSKYKATSEEERLEELKTKVNNLVNRINALLASKEEISSIDYPELYHRIQEVIALEDKIANKLISDSFESEGINHCMSCGDSLFGRPCTYYFSKSLSYKE